jgi:hypothetical protein
MQKQATYGFQVSVESLRNDQVMNLESPSPFQAIQVGEKISLQAVDAKHWFPDGEVPKFAYVVDKTHYLTDTDERVFHIVHVAVSLKQAA